MRRDWGEGVVDGDVKWIKNKLIEERKKAECEQEAVGKPRSGFLGFPTGGSAPSVPTL